MQGDAGADFLFAQSKTVDLDIAILLGDLDIGSGLKGDLLGAGAGNDVLLGAQANDTLLGGAGRDQIIADAGDDNLIGDATLSSYADAQMAVTEADATSKPYQWNVVRSIVTETTGGQRYNLNWQATFGTIGDTYPVAIAADPESSDSLYAGNGNDWVLEQNGNDFVDAGPGNDTVWGGAGNDVIYGRERGRVLVDGLDLTLADASSLRRQIGVVLQENVLFNRTLRENIALADPGAPMDAVIAVLRVFDLSGFVARQLSGRHSVPKGVQHETNGSATGDTEDEIQRSV